MEQTREVNGQAMKEPPSLLHKTTGFDFLFPILTLVIDILERAAL